MKKCLIKISDILFLKNKEDGTFINIYFSFFKKDKSFFLRTENFKAYSFSQYQAVIKFVQKFGDFDTESLIFLQKHYQSCQDWIPKENPPQRQWFKWFIDKNKWIKQVKVISCACVDISENDLLIDILLVEIKKPNSGYTEKLFILFSKDQCVTFLEKYLKNISQDSISLILEKALFLPKLSKQTTLVIDDPVIASIILKISENKDQPIFI